MADFLSTLQSFESGDRRHPDRGGSNIANTTQGTSSGQAQGFNQITTGTWKEFGGLAYAPTPLEATPEQQNAIAAKIPLKRWAPETLAYLKNNGFDVNPNATLADNIALNHGTLGVAPAPHTPTPGTTLNSVPGASPPPAGGPAAPAAPGAPAAAQGNWMTKLASALKPQDKGAGGGGEDQPPDFRLNPVAPAQAAGGGMMMGAGGQNTFGRNAAEQGLAQRGFMTQPSLAAFNAYKPPSPIGAPSPGGVTPGSAEGVPAMPGTTLNSPSQLQMAMGTGQMDPNQAYSDLYNQLFGGQRGGYGMGSA